MRSIYVWVVYARPSIHLNPLLMPAGADASKTDTTQHDKKLFEAVRRLVDRRIPGSMVTGEFRDACGSDCVGSISVSLCLLHALNRPQIASCKQAK